MKAKPHLKTNTQDSSRQADITCPTQAKKNALIQLLSSSNMYLDLNLKSEVLSVLFGNIIQPYDKNRHVTRPHILSLDEFHLCNIIGKHQAYVEELFFHEEDFLILRMTLTSLIYLTQLNVEGVTRFMCAPRDGIAWPYGSKVNIQIETPGWEPMDGGNTLCLENGLFLSMEHLWMELEASSGNTTE